MKTLKVLIAEKDRFLRSIIESRLTACGYDVIETETSQATMDVLEREHVDLLLMSGELERIHGKMLIEEIRSEQGLLAIPIILLTEENRISELLMSQERGFDDFITKPVNPFILQLRVSINIARVNQRVEANALTHLPGNVAIERVIKSKIEKDEKFSALYIDINNFKAFNDKYGFEKGDDVIKHTARLLLQTAKEVTGDGFCFVGHIGGDDFLVVTDPEFEEDYAHHFLKAFDRIMPSYYSEKDRRRGMFRVTNRKGKRENFPLMSCSIAGCTNLYRPYKSLGEIAHDASEVKSFLKMQPGSCYLRDRRSAPLSDLNEAMNLLTNAEEKVEASEANLLGQKLLCDGVITTEQLEIALRRHQRTGKPLGRVLIAMHAASSEDVGLAISKQKGVPYVSLRHIAPIQDLQRFFTKKFMQEHQVVALESNEEGLKLAMCRPDDAHTITAVERITGLPVRSCLTLEDELEDFLYRLPSGSPDFHKKTG